MEVDNPALRDLKKRYPDAQPHVEQTAAATKVIIEGIHIPFWDLVVLMVKFAIALIPAATILFVIGSFIAALLPMLLTSGSG